MQVPGLKLAPPSVSRRVCRLLWINSIVFALSLSLSLAVASTIIFLIIFYNIFS
jgi:hypothetical protein